MLLFGFRGHERTHGVSKPDDAYHQGGDDENREHGIEAHGGEQEHGGAEDVRCQEWPQIHHGCHDAEAGRNPCNPENP